MRKQVVIGVIVAAILAAITAMIEVQITQGRHDERLKSLEGRVDKATNLLIKLLERKGL